MQPQAGANGQPLVLKRNVTISAQQRFLDNHVFVLWDWSNIIGAIELEKDVFLILRGFEFINHMTEIGFTFKPLSLSLDATLVWDTCVHRRIAGLPLEPGLANTLAAPRIGGGAQIVYLQQHVCFNTTRSAAPACYDLVMVIGDWASHMPEDVTMAFLNQSHGGFNFYVTDTLYVVDHTAAPSCYQKKPPRECVADLLAKLEGGDEGDDNTAVIVLAVVIPTCALLLMGAGTAWFVVSRRRRRATACAVAAQDAASQQPSKRRSDDLRKCSSGSHRFFTGIDGDETGWGDVPPVDLGGLRVQVEEAPRATSSAQRRAAGAGMGMGGSATPSGATGSAAVGLGLSGPGAVGRHAPSTAYAGSATHCVSDGASEGKHSQQLVQQQDASGGRQLTGSVPGGLIATGGDASAALAGHGSANGLGMAASDGSAALCPRLGAQLPPGHGPGAGYYADGDLSPHAAAGGGVTSVALSDNMAVLAELEALSRSLRIGINDAQLTLQDVIGSGSFGTVYKGLWQGLPVAIKSIVFSASSDNRKRALQEAALCQSIGHPNIVATYAVDAQPIGALQPQLPPVSGSTSATLPSAAAPGAGPSSLSTLVDWRLYIVQELCDGGPLRGVVQRRETWASEGPDMGVICELSLGIAMAMAHLHSKSIVHGDLNPNNVLLKRDPGAHCGSVAKVADFGLSVLLPNQKTHMSNLRLGTPFYMAPEVVYKGLVSFKSDVFSLGVILWELYHARHAGMRSAEGALRYQPDFPRFPPECPAEYRRVTFACLQKQPSNRPSMAQVQDWLEDLAHSLGQPLDASM